MVSPRLRWYAAGDVNAFFGLALDNLTQLVILSSLLIGLYGFPADLVLFRMVPGTALGVLVGDLTYTWLAWRLARRTGREDVTAMPFGIDTPSLFGIVFGVLGPVMQLTRNPTLAWPLFGIIHSPLPNGALFWPWNATSAIPTVLAGSYGVVAAFLWLLGDAPLDRP